MPAYFPPILGDGSGPFGLRAGGELSLSLSATTLSIVVRPYTFIEDINVYVAITFSGIPTMYVGDDGASAIWMNSDSITWAIIGSNLALADDSTYGTANGYLYLAANNLNFVWTPPATQTQGRAYVYVSYHYLPDMSSGAMYTALR